MNKLVSAIDLAATEYYVNRELSLVAFNKRVLAQAKDSSIPLLERLFFLCVTSSNLDEFFEVRVSGLKEKVARDLLELGPDGLSPSASLETISETAHEIVDEQYEVLNRALLPELAQAGIRFLARDAWTPELVAWVQRYFND
jgi:polyphosphate kinase